MSFSSSSAASPSGQVTSSTSTSPVLQAAASPAAQPVVAPPPIPLPPPSAHSPVLGSANNGFTINPGGLTGVFSAEGNIATSPQGDPNTPNLAKATLLGK